jgi:transcriptional regulator with XRE-family HTH domain
VQTAHVDGTNYQRVLGDELRKVRKARGWTRKDLQSRLGVDISLQTLATYELGTRQCSVVRLVELCAAMEELPHNLLERVHQRVFTEQSVASAVLVDLSNVIKDEQSELLPFRRWALDRFNELPAHASTEIRLGLPALERLAELCGLDTVELIRRLRRLDYAGDTS